MSTETDRIKRVIKLADWTVETLPEHRRPDFEFDEDNKRILQELEWNEWAWCTVKVTGSLFTLEASEYLGGCSYRDSKEFVKESGYFESMQTEVAKELLKQIDAIKERNI